MSVHERPSKDERDKQIDARADHYALTFVQAGIQVFTLACLFKKNPAWLGSLSLLFLGSGAALLYKYDKYEDKPHFYVGAGMGAIGAAMLLRFCMKG